MNEQKAIDFFKNNFPDYIHEEPSEKQIAYNTAIQALEEVQAYRAVGTVKEIKIREAQFARLSEGYLSDLTLLREYQSIGTIEEFKALREKSVAKKPTYSDFDENEAGEIIPYKAVCPICGHEFEFGTWNDEENHHCVCGQKLDWSE